MTSIFVVGGIASGIDHVLSFAAVVTAAFAGTTRYVAVLSDADSRRVERATALGFFLGVPVSALILAIDRIGLV